METRWQKATRCAEKRRELFLMDGPLNANTVATASQRRSTFIRVKRPHASTEWAKGVRWRANLRNKRFTAEEMGTWQHRCAHCEVSFPCRSGLTRQCKRAQEREKGCRCDRKWFCVATMDGNRTACSCALASVCCVPAFRCSPVCSVPCCGCRPDRLRLLCSLCPHVARTSVTDPGVSVQVGFQRFFVSSASVM